MKYFIDTEFIEGFHKPFLGKRRHFIDLISIGIYCEDGRSYSAISNEYRYHDASDWVKENVIEPLFRSTVSGFAKDHCYFENFHHAYGKSNKQIAIEILEFFGCTLNNGIWNEPHKLTAPKDIEIYAYYADYDWVLFCSLFGRMIDLPEGFPMYCIDLKQSLDELAHNEARIDGGKFDNCLKALKENPHYPKPTNEHNALADAKWNYELYKFLNL